MKKKLLVLLIVLVLSAVMVVASACKGDKGMFVKDDARDFAQVSAEIKYAGRTSQVTKATLNSTLISEYNSNYQYYNQYGYGSYYAEQFMANIDERYDQYNETLAKQEAYVLLCLDALYKQAVAKDPSVKEVSTEGKAYDIDARVAEITKVLSVVSQKDLIAAIEAYNENRQKVFDELRAAYEKEVANRVAAKSSDNVKEIKIDHWLYVTEYEVGATLDERGLVVKAIYEDGSVVTLDRSDFTLTGFSSESVAKQQELTVTFGEATAVGKVDIVEAKPSRPTQPTDEDTDSSTVPALFKKALQDKIDAARTTDLDEYKLLVEVRRRLDKQMETNYRTYEFIYLEFLKEQVVTCCERIIGEEAEAGVTAEMIRAEYDKLLSEQLKVLKDGDKTYYEICNPTTSGDEFVANEPKQIVHEDTNFAYVYHILFKTENNSDLKKEYDALKSAGVVDPEALGGYFNDLSDRYRVYISNPKYDADATCEKESCTCKQCENYKGENPGACTEEECACVDCLNNRYLNKSFAEKYGEKYGFTRNEDGTINVHDVINVITGELTDVSMTDGSYAERKAILDSFKNWVYQCNDDDGMFTYLNGNGEGYGFDDETANFVSDFKELSLALSSGDPAAYDLDNEWHIVGAGIGSYGYCYSEYGIHIVMLSGYALPKEYITDANLIEEGYYKIPLDAVVNLTEYDAATGKGTLRYYIEEDLKSSENEKALGAFQKKFFEMLEGDSVSITYDAKVYQDLIEEIKDSQE